MFRFWISALLCLFFFRKQVGTVSGIPIYFSLRCCI